MCACESERVGVCSCVHLSVCVRRFDSSKALDETSNFSPSTHDGYRTEEVTHTVKEVTHIVKEVTHTVKEVTHTVKEVTLWGKPVTQ